MRLMPARLLTGNESMGLGAIAAGVNIVCGYPGTPSTEVLETVAANNPGQAIHVEWSTNEKAALELAAGASYCGARCLVTMKQVGLNVATDPLMSLRYIGVKGGLVLLVADDPGPISSQTEQDTRRFASYSKVPVLDPSTTQEAYEMMIAAFGISERYETPVIVRPTTRISHGGGLLDPASPDDYKAHPIVGFERDPKWVIFPKRALAAHRKIVADLPVISAEFDSSRFNSANDIHIGGCAGAAPGTPRVGIATGGTSFAYLSEALRRPEALGIDPDGEGVDLRILKVGTPYPFPDGLGRSFLEGLDEVLCLEELDGVIEDALVSICGHEHLPVRVHGRHDGLSNATGENSADTVLEDMGEFLSRAGLASSRPACGETDSSDADLASSLPPRPPVLCAGCPHRGAFFAVKRACKGKKAFFSGDIGCYTLGNAMPLDMVDNCLCMGAGITMAQGMKVAEPDAESFAFVGDSTFFASGITGVVNAVYNGNDINLMVLDNSTTAMTGHQPHPGTGARMSLRPDGKVSAEPISIRAILEAIGVSPVLECDPCDLEESVRCVEEVMDTPGTSAIIFKSPCVAIVKRSACAHVEQERCTTCYKCIRELGCPAISITGGDVEIDGSQCNGCGLCVQVCPFDAIEVEEVSR